jgi:hypothetical protein
MPTIRTSPYTRRLTAVAVLCLSIISSVSAGCAHEEIWPKYVNSNFGYSIEYPAGWSASEPFQNKQMVIIKSPDGTGTISVLVNQAKGLSLDQQVNYNTSAVRTGSYDYQIISDNRVKHQGIDAELLEVKYQSQKDAPRLSVMELYLINGGALYLMRFTTTAQEMTASIPTYKRVFASFKLSGQP